MTLLVSRSFRRVGRSALEWGAPTTAGGVLLGLVSLLVDSALRHVWGASPLQHVEVSLWLVSAFGGGMGMLLWTGVALETRLARRVPRGLRRARPLLYACVVGLLTYETAEWLFSGERVGRTVLARVGPPALVGAMMLGAALVFICYRRAYRASADRLGPALWVSACSVLVAALLTAVDLGVLVSLYDRLHTLLQAMAWALLLPVATFWLARAARASRSVLHAVRGCAAFGVMAVTSLFASHALRASAENALSHTWREQLLVGRAQRWLSRLDLWLENPWLEHRRNLDSRALRVARLLDRYGITTPSLAPSWTTAAHIPEARASRADTLRRSAFPPGAGRPDVVVFFVDTLRADVASDARLMPRLARFRKSALDFKRAYASGTDTATSLPGLFGGAYVPGDANTSLQAAALEGKYSSTLIIPRSAREYLAKRRPGFHFSRTEEVRDYDAGQHVWGYGATEPSSSRVVDRAIARLGAKGERPQLLWVYVYDVHDWRELDDRFVESAARRAGVAERGDRSWRYRAVAAEVDVQFGRLLDAIDQLGRRRRTIVLFVADHGEALGQNGFWVHTYYLWESLLRVPLVLRVPGIEPRVVDSFVSLADIPPTLAPFMRRHARPGWQGEDLLLRVVAPGATRTRPILFTSSAGGHPAQIGLLDIEHRGKLVLHIGAPRPEYYSLDAADPDARDLAPGLPVRTASLLQSLVHAPNFPR